MHFTAIAVLLHVKQAEEHVDDVPEQTNDFIVAVAQVVTVGNGFFAVEVFLNFVAYKQVVIGHDEGVLFCVEVNTLKGDFIAVGILESPAYKAVQGCTKLDRLTGTGSEA